MTDQRITTRSGRETSPWTPVHGRSAAPPTVTHRMRERMAEREEARRRLRWRGLARLAAGAVLGLGLLWLVLVSNVFALDPAKVRIDGQGPAVDSALVEAAVASHAGTSLALLNTGHLANQIRDIPGVRDAAVERVWPQGLTVTLIAREPVAAIEDPAGGFVLVDDEGVRLGHSETPPTDIPVVVVPLGDDNVRILRSVLAVVHELPVDLRERVLGIRADTEDSVTFTLRDGPRVEWGSADQSALKAEVLLVLLESDEAAAAAVIDVSAPTLPITRSE